MHHNFSLSKLAEADIISIYRYIAEEELSPTEARLVYEPDYRHIEDVKSVSGDWTVPSGYYVTFSQGISHSQNPLFSLL